MNSMQGYNFYITKFVLSCALQMCVMWGVS